MDINDKPGFPVRVPGNPFETGIDVTGKTICIMVVGCWHVLSHGHHLNYHQKSPMLVGDGDSCIAHTRRSDSQSSINVAPTVVGIYPDQLLT
ncbi:hypothetical protein ACE6H2_008743 [Prunus campanulata]